MRIRFQMFQNNCRNKMLSTNNRIISVLWPRNLGNDFPVHRDPSNIIRFTQTSISTILCNPSSFKNFYRCNTVCHCPGGLNHFVTCFKNSDSDALLGNHEGGYEADWTGADNDYIGVGFLCHSARERRSVVVKVSETRRYIVGHDLNVRRGRIRVGPGPSTEQNCRIADNTTVLHLNGYQEGCGSSQVDLGISGLQQHRTIPGSLVL